MGSIKMGKTESLVVYVTVQVTQFYGMNNKIIISEQLFEKNIKLKTCNYMHTGV